MDTSHISTRGNKKKGARYQCRGRIKVKNDEVVVMSEHSHAPIVARADMLKTQSDSKQRAASTLGTPQQIISGAAADLGEEDQ